MKAYSLDLRERVLAALDAGMTYDQASATFQVSRATVGRWRQRQRQTGSCAPRTSPGRPPRVAHALDAELIAQVAADPDATLREHAARWNTTQPTPASPSSIRRALARADWTRKKRP
jgi:transposase